MAGIAPVSDGPAGFSMLAQRLGGCVRGMMKRRQPNATATLGVDRGRGLPTRTDALWFPFVLVRFAEFILILPFV